MRFANANDDFEIAKMIVVNMMIKILTDFMQRQIKSHISVIIINVFSLFANEKRNVNQDINI